MRQYDKNIYGIGGLINRLNALLPKDDDTGYVERIVETHFTIRKKIRVETNGLKELNPAGLNLLKTIDSGIYDFAEEILFELTEQGFNIYEYGKDLNNGQYTISRHILGNCWCICCPAQISQKSIAELGNEQYMFSDDIVKSLMDDSYKFDIIESRKYIYIPFETHRFEISLVSKRGRIRQKGEMIHSRIVWTEQK